MDLLHPSGRHLPQTTEEAEVFQAHAYRLAIKCYQPQLPFNILLKEPKLEQFSRLSYDPDLIYRPPLSLSIFHNPSVCPAR